MARINPVRAEREFQDSGTLGDRGEENRDGAEHGLDDGPIARRRPSVPRGATKALAGGSLPDALRQQISLTVSEANQCDYCVSAHSFYGSKAGLSESDLLDARHGMASDEKTNAALAFARKIVEDRGHVNDEDVEEVRRAGYTDGEIAEIVANVGMTTFTNYFNHVAGTEVDFPYVPLLVAVLTPAAVTEERYSESERSGFKAAARRKASRASAVRPTRW